LFDEFKKRISCIVKPNCVSGSLLLCDDMTRQVYL